MGHVVYIIVSAFFESLFAGFKELDFWFVMVIHVFSPCTIENAISNEPSSLGVEISLSFFFRYCRDSNYVDAWPTRHNASRTTGSDRNDAVNEYFRAVVTE